MIKTSVKNAVGKTNLAKNTLTSYAFGGALLVFLMFIFLYRLDLYPTPRFDEGAYLNVAKTLVNDGVYAERTVSGYSFIGPVASAGPTVILPIAVVFKVSGVSLLSARLVGVIYGFLALGMVYALAHQLMDKRAALAALLLVIFGWGDGLRLPEIFRNVKAEAPGLFFLFAGLWLWLNPRPKRWTTLVGIGILFGLASISRTQYGLFVLPSLLIAWLLDLSWYRRKKWVYFVVPGVLAGAIFFGWIFYSYYLLGANMRDVQADIAALRTAGKLYFIFEIPKMFQNVYLLANGFSYGGLFIPATLLGIILAIKRNTEKAQEWGIISTFVLTSSLVFIGTIGWQNMAISPRMIAVFVVTRLLYSLTNGFRFNFRELFDAIKSMQELTPSVLTRLLVVGLLIILVFLPMLRALYYVSQDGDNTAYLTAQYLEETVPDDAIIETWEKELSVLTTRNFHYPPQIMEAYMNNYVHRNGRPVWEIYDPRDYLTPDFIVAGFISDIAGIYTGDMLTNYELLATFGQFRVYGRSS